MRVRPTWHSVLLVITISVAIWVTNRPYSGIRHDGILYFGQVLSHGLVPALDNDPFFAYGSQDRYSIYSPLVGWLYSHLGVAPTHQICLLSCQLASGIAIWLLLRRWANPHLASFGMLCVACLSPFYGAGLVFSYGEPFLTARSFAEPLALWSVVALLGRRYLIAGCLQFAAAMMHPLMVLPIMASAAVFGILSHRRWVLLPIASAALAGALALADVAPWNGLLRSFDPYWWSLVEQANRNCLITHWISQDFIVAAVDLAILFSAQRLTARPSRERRWLTAMMVAGVALLVASLIGADLLKLQLLTALQLWRVLWVWHVFALALIPWLIWTLWRSGEPHQRVIALSLMGAAYAAHVTAVNACWALLVSAAFCALLRDRVHLTNPKLLSALRWTLSIAILALYFGHATDLFYIEPIQKIDSFAPPLAIELLIDPVMVLLLVMGFWHFRQGRPVPESIGLAASLAVAFVAIGHWDRRNALATALEANVLGSHPFQREISQNKSVYWADGLPVVWGWLQRSSHYSTLQNAGVLFNRGTAYTLGPRREAYRLIDDATKRCRNGALFALDAQALERCATPSEHLVAKLCSQTERPDYLVFPARIGDLKPLASWSPQSDPGRTTTFQLYACQQFTAID